MTKQLRQLMDELITIEPSLAGKEKEISKVLSELLSTKEDLTLSEEVVTRLKQRVLSAKPVQTRFQSFFTLLHMNTKHIALGSAGALAAVVLAIGAYALYTPGGPTALVNNQTSQTIALGPNAFGSLGEAYTNDPSPAPQAAMLGAEAALSSRSIATNPVVGFGGGGMAVSEPAVADKMMIMPYFSYEYAYVGEDIELPTDLPVYRRTINTAIGQSMAQAVRGVNNGMINIPSGLRVENLNLQTSGRDGFSYHLDFRTQNVNIYEETSVYNDNWNGRNALDDATLIDLATTFLEDRGVDLAAYGDPSVDTRYTRWQSEGSVVPQQLTVIFPILTPSGETVYERSGDAPAGIGVSVDQSRRTAVSAYNIRRLQFESSRYDLTTDIDRVLDVAAQGGDVHEPWRPEDAEIVTFGLGTPTVVYIEYHKYDEETGTSNELYIPALRFPIVDRPEQEVYYNPEFVTVPLVAELLKAPEQTEPYPMPRPLPVEPLEAPAVEPEAL